MIGDEDDLERLWSDDPPTHLGSRDPSSESNSSLEESKRGLNYEAPRVMRGIVVGVVLGTAFWLVVIMILFIILTA